MNSNARENINVESGNNKEVLTSQLLDMRGGPLSSMIPALVFVVILFWLSFESRASISGFWVGGWLAILVGLFLAKSPNQFAASVVRGLRDETGVLIIAAFIFAGVFGTILSKGGLVNGLLWIGTETGLTGAKFTVLAFILASIFGVGTGTSVGTVVAMVPILLPAGIYLGSDPTMLALAIIAGGAFGDNLAPISDTTISSAYSSGAEMGDVVRTRLPLSLTAALISIIIFAIFGGGGTVVNNAVEHVYSPMGLIMIVPFVVVIILAMSKQHIIAALMWGSLIALILGVATNLISVSDIFSIPEKRGDSTGLIENGIRGVVGPVVLVLFILSMAQVVKESGLMNIILAKLQKHAAQGVRSAEFIISGITLLFTVPLGANAPAILLVGPAFAVPLGQEKNLSPSRIANLMDCSANTVFYMLPWHNAVIVWFATVATTSEQYGFEVPSIWAAALNPYAWALLLVLVISITTGWNRKFT